jgi:hypothetical protein
VEILWIIGVLVMVPMVCCPPKRTALNRHATDRREQELNDSPGLESAMGEVAMVESG